MPWWIVITELTNEWGIGKEKFRLIAYSHKTKEAHSLCNHDHFTPDEARECPEAMKNRINFEGK